MEQLKRMIGIVVGIFCTLVAAGLSSFLFRLDARWFYSLELPGFMLSGGAFGALVAVSYLSCVLAISRLVEHKHIFPSMLFFLGLGASAVMFVLTFFTLKQLMWGLVFMGATLGFACALFFRFLTKDVKIALEFAPAFLFDMYGFVVVLYIAMAN